MDSRVAELTLKGMSDRYKNVGYIDPKCYMAEEAIDFAIEAAGRVKVLEAFKNRYFSDVEGVKYSQIIALEKENMALRKQVEENYDPRKHG